MNYNHVTIAGNLTRDPELRWTPKGMAICAGGLAINRKVKTEGGEQKDDVTFVDFTAFGKTAENINQWFSKGKPIFLVGRLRMESWTDKASGQNRSKLSVVVDSFQFVGGKEPDAEPGPAPPPPAAQPNLPPSMPPPRAMAGAAKGGKAGDPQNNDDLPF